jgi:hypothetical protein
MPIAAPGSPPMAEEFRPHPGHRTSTLILNPSVKDAIRRPAPVRLF